MQIDRTARAGYLNVIERAEAVLYGYSIEYFWPEGEPPEFTCDNCAHMPECSLAFDLYNTNGDCLASK